MEGDWLKPSATTPGSGRQGPFLGTPWSGGTPPSCRRKTRVFDGSEGVDTESKGLPDGTWVRLEG